MGREIAKMGLTMKLDDLALFLTVVRCGSFCVSGETEIDVHQHAEPPYSAT